jgi:hypothetical protein
MSELVFTSAEMILDEARRNIETQMENRIQGVTYGELKPFTAGNYGTTTFYANQIAGFELPQPLTNSWAYVKSLNDVERVNSYDAFIGNRLFKVVNNIFVNPEILLTNPTYSKVDVSLEWATIESWNPNIPNFVGNSITIANQNPLIEAMQDLKNKTIIPMGEIVTRNNKAINFLLGDVENGVDGFLKSLINELNNDWQIINARVDEAQRIATEEINNRFDRVDANIAELDRLAIQDLNLMLQRLDHKERILREYVDQEISRTLTQIDSRITDYIEPLATDIEQAFQDIELIIEETREPLDTRIDEIKENLALYLKTSELPTQPIFSVLNNSITERLNEQNEIYNQGISELEGKLTKIKEYVVEIILNPHILLPRISSYLKANESNARGLFHSILIKLL